jgi:glycosyltransferase involved in cell wall biosynthesis
VKVAFVTPRYGPDVIGGAEAAARSLAEHLVHDLGHEAEIYTTCALSYVTWANELAPGVEMINGVTVRRFLSDSGRDIVDTSLDRELYASPRSASYEETMRWIKQCGPVTTELLAALDETDADVVVFYPYLYYMTVHGIGRVAKPAVLHPAAHDEPYLYFLPFEDVFAAADGIAFHTDAERTLVERIMPIAGTPEILLGVGVDPPLPSARSGCSVLGIEERPYVVCVGRVDPHKGSVMLNEYFTEFKRRHPGPEALVFVGPNAAGIESSADVIVAGILDEQDKWDVIADASVLISPSAMESFSLVVLEAWQKRLAVMVNAMCAPTVEHCARSGGGLPFDSYYSFDAALHRLLQDESLRRQLGQRGFEYVEGHFTWPVMIRRYERFLQEVISRGRTPLDPGSPLLAPYLL